MAGSAILFRLTFARLGLLALSALAVALPLTLWVFLESRTRYQHDVDVRSRRGARGGRASAALAAVTTVLALLELVALVVAP